MVKANYEPALARVLVDEGGFANHPKDPGGRTLQGITQRVYDGYRVRNNKPLRQLTPILVRDPTWAAERAEIYRMQYAGPAKFDDLPIGVDYVQFDGAVNSGPRQAGKWLQRALAAAGLYTGPIDGLVGEATLRAVEQHPDHDRLIAAILKLREAFMRALKTWSAFKVGWLARLTHVLAGGQAWATGSVPAKTMAVAGSQAKADIEDADLPSNTITKTAGSTAGGATIAVVIEQTRQSIEPYAGSFPLVDKILVGLVVAGAIATAGGVLYGVWAKRKTDRVSKAIDLDGAVPA